MLRNNYIEPYKIHKRKLSEFENELRIHDENYLLNLVRPLSAKSIKQVPKKALSLFIDDIMCNKSMNKLLYQSNANKEELFYIKEKNIFIKNLSMANLNPPPESLFKKKKKLAMFQKIKENISEYKNSKKSIIKILRVKNKIFEKKISNIRKLMMEESFRNIRDNRMKGYEKAIQNCLRRSTNNSKFSLPETTLNINNVYSRLYHNAILKPSQYQTKTLGNTHYTNKKNEISTKQNLSNILHKHKKIENIEDEDDLEQIKIKMMPKFKLKKVLNEYEGKEFNIKPSIIAYEKCWRKNSGGPKIDKNFSATNEIKSNSQYYDDESKEIMDVISYRDKDNNTSLNLAVKNNNIKFVKYFLNKKNNPNVQNKFGNTALHLSMKHKNKKLIGLLINNGADVNIQNNKKITPYDLASKDIIDEFKLDKMINI